MNNGLAVAFSPRAFAIDTDADIVYYLASGAFYSSSNGGTNWAITASGGWSLAIDPTTSTTLYIGALNGSMVRSLNGGGSTTPVNNGLTGSRIETISVDPFAGNNVLAGDQEGLFATADSGTAWTAQNSGIIATAVQDLIENPQDPSTVYAGLRFKGISKSTDRGQSWSDPDVVPSLPNNTDIQALAIDPQTPTTVFAGTLSNSVFKSTDGGASWLIAPSSISGSVIESLAVDPAVPAVIYAGTRDEGVMKSTDNGNTWAPANNGLTDTFIESLAIDPQTPTTIYAGTVSSSIFKSVDGGSIWTLSDNGISGLRISKVLIDPNNSNTLFAISPGLGIFHSGDSGSTWTAITSPPDGIPTELAIDSLVPDMIYSSGGQSVSRSVDGGNSWEALDGTNPDLFFGGFSILLSSDQPGLVHVGTSRRGLRSLQVSPDSILGTLATPASQIPLDLEFTYTFNIVNNGPFMSSLGTLTQTVPSNANFVSAISDQGNCGEAAGQVTCELGVMSVGQQVAVVTRFLATSTGLVSTSASFATYEPDSVPGDTSFVGASTEVLRHSDMSAVLTGPAQVNKGNDLIYSIAINNGGPNDSLTTTLSHTLSAGTSFVSASTPQGVCNEAMGVVSCNLGKIDSGINVIVTTTVSANSVGSQQSSVAVATDSIETNPIDDTDSLSVVVIGESELGLAITASAGSVIAGNNVSYAIVATNNGPDEATGISLTVSPTNGTIVSVIPDQGTCSVTMNTLTCSLGTIAASANASVALTVRAVSAGTLLTTGAISGLQTDSVSANDMVSQNVTVTNPPAPPAPPTPSSGGGGGSLGPLLLGWMTFLLAVGYRRRLIAKCSAEN